MRLKNIVLVPSVLAIVLIGFLLLPRTLFGLAGKLDKYVKSYVEIGRFSGSVLVAKEGKILLSKGYGMANYEHDVPNTSQTKFRLGSLTKQFTAMVVMQLQEAGKLSVQDPLSKYIPDYPNGDKITIHHLLTHTSGIPNYIKFPEYGKKKIKPHTINQLIARFKNKPLEFKPGEKYAYSNSGYALLTDIIEKVTGQMYEAVVKKQIFDPLRMKNSGYDSFKRIIKNRASGYSREGEQLINADYIDISMATGSGALYSTVEDLYLWDQALYSDKLLSKKSRDLVFAEHILANAALVRKKEEFYGYGWYVGTTLGRHSADHSGSIDGFQTHILRYLDDKVTIIILGNNDRSNVSRIAQGLAAIVFGEKQVLPQKQVSMSPELYNQYVGLYTATLEQETLTFIVTKVQDKLFVQLDKQDAYEVYPSADNEFFYKAVVARILFIKDGKGNVTKLILHQDGIDVVAHKVEEK